MSEQYCLFDSAERAANSRPYVAPAPEPYRQARRGKFYKITLNDGKIIIVETDKGILELVNEIRSRAKVIFAQPDWKSVTCDSEAIRYIERIYRWELSHIYGYAMARAMTIGAEE